MRIAVDASVLETTRPTGVERMLREQLRALAAAGSEAGTEAGRAAARHEFLLVSRRPIELGFALPSHFRAIDLAADRAAAQPGRFWREALLDPLLRREKVALLHSPVLALPMALRRPPYALVATVHEVPWREPGGGAGLELARRYRLADAARRAQRLIAVSNHTRDHVVALHPEAAARTVVVPHGVEPRFAPQPPAPLAAAVEDAAPRDPLAAERAALLARYRLPDAPFLLFVGAARARKNLAGLLVAYAALPAALRERHPLLLAGVDGDAATPLRAQSQRLAVADRLLLPGFIDDGDLPAIYRAAHALLFPSRFEGFGLPLLEAMASGLPIVASRGGALPEVAGDAALLLDDGAANIATASGAPLTAPSTAALTAAIARIATDGPLREQLRSRGLARAAQFRWSRAAEQLLALWESCA